MFCIYDPWPLHDICTHYNDTIYNLVVTLITNCCFIVYIKRYPILMRGTVVITIGKRSACNEWVSSDYDFFCTFGGNCIFYFFYFIVHIHNKYLTEKINVMIMIFNDWKALAIIRGKQLLKWEKETVVIMRGVNISHNKNGRQSLYAVPYRSVIVMHKLRVYSDQRRAFFLLRKFCCGYTVQTTFIFIDFCVCDFAFVFKTCFIIRQISICVLNANETFVWLVNAFDASYIAHYRSNGYAPLHRTLSLKWIWPAVSETLVLNDTKPTKRSQITDQNLRNEANAKCAVSVHAKRVSNS